MLAPRVETIDLGFRPRAWQSACFLGMRRFSVIVVHRRGGKTVMAIMRLIHKALKFEGRAGRYAYIAPLLKQSKAIAWSYLKHYALKLPGTTHNESELWVEFPNGARITLYGADNPDAFRGQYFDGTVLDEVAQMKPEVWGEILRPALADRNGWALFIGTPKGINLFSELYFRALSDDDWFAGAYTCNDTDALPQGEIDAMRDEMTDNQFRQEMLCDFTASSDNVLMPIDLVEEAARRHPREDAYSWSPRVIGVDVAGEGGDKTVLMPRQGLAAFKPVAIEGLDQLRIADRVAQAIVKFKPEAVFVDDTGGYGGGVVARLRELGHPVIGINFASKATNPRYANKRAEMYWTCAEWLKQGGAIPNIPNLKADLCSIVSITDDPRGTLKLNPKDEIREQLGRSTDWGDALALTFAMPIAAPMPAGLRPEAPKVRADYDPLAVV